MRYAPDALSYSYLKKRCQRSSNEQIGADFSIIRDTYGGDDDYRQ